MASFSILHTGTSGVQTGLQNAERAASDIARLNAADEASTSSSVTDLAEAAVDLIVSENQVKASAAVIRTGDEVLGTLIDTLA